MSQSGLLKCPASCTAFSPFRRNSEIIPVESNRLAVAPQQRYASGLRLRLSLAASKVVAAKERVVRAAQDGGFTEDDERQYMNVWWDSDASPPPFDLNVCNIAYSVIDMVPLEYTDLPVFFRIYGRHFHMSLERATTELLIRAGFPDARVWTVYDERPCFRLPNGKSTSKMGEDLIKISEKQWVHFVVKEETVARSFEFLKARKLVCLEPEEYAVNGDWVWRPCPYRWNS